MFPVSRWVSTCARIREPLLGLNTHTTGSGTAFGSFLQSTVTTRVFGNGDGMGWESNENRWTWVPKDSSGGNIGPGRPVGIPPPPKKTIRLIDLWTTFLCPRVDAERRLLQPEQLGHEQRGVGSRGRAGQLGSGRVRRWHVAVRRAQVHAQFVARAVRTGDQVRTRAAAAAVVTVRREIRKAGGRQSRKQRSRFFYA